MKEKDLMYEKNLDYIKSGFDVSRRVIEIHEVDMCDTPNLIRAIDLMELEGTAPIKVFINSPGGDVYCGLALYDRLRECKSEIHTYVRGMAMSMGLILTLAGDKREASINSRFMAHSVSSGTWGKVRDQEVDLEETKTLNNLLISLLAERTKKDSKWWADFIKHEDKYFNKTQAKKLGVL
jgi:ATP-dependent Clp endopeptidase proteolytic subunit ClpP